jgi:hypothetical protein
MPRGGFRPGAGRKKGAAEVRTRRIANELAREGQTPLQVMIDTMRELCQQAAEAPTAADGSRRNSRPARSLRTRPPSFIRG